MSISSQDQEWDGHWYALGERRSIFGFLSRLVRQFVFQSAVRHYAEKYFPPEGTFVEMGCGTAESSARIPMRRRNLVGLDFSRVALRSAQTIGCMSGLVCGDLRCLPIRDGSLTGAWNLGVMEHFEPAELAQLFAEFHRVLKPGGVVILFWPTEHNSSRWILGPIEFLRSRFGSEQFRFFPAEVSRLRSRKQATELLLAAGFRPAALRFSMRTMFIHMVVVASAVAK